MATKLKGHSFAHDLPYDSSYFYYYNTTILVMYSYLQQIFPHILFIDHL
jgi:hypothetical protein